MGDKTGGQQDEQREQLKPKELATDHLGVEAVHTLIGNSNVEGSKGGFDGKYHSVTIDANDQLRTAEEYGNLILTYENGAALRLKDIAHIEQGPENSFQSAWANNQPAIVISVQRQPGANVIQVVTTSRRSFPHCRRRCRTG